MQKPIRIVENSVFAWIASKVLRSKKVAITFGRSIHLNNTSLDEFINSSTWLRHELKHVQQYKRYGFGGFLLRYLWWSIKYGYYSNPLEKEARLAESDIDIVKHFTLPTSSRQA